ncbi:MAG: soluble aldose sugar dehydrogenase YliI [Fibrobacteres bacterium]|nr:soluble aldose sugar dehydrogenase YliI [Fibrobacterota bacterium]
MKNSIRSIYALSFAALLGTAHAVDLGTYKGCAATDAEFKSTTLFSGADVLKMAFASQDDGSVDVYFIQKSGGVKRYNATTKAVDNIGSIPVDASGEYGLVGVAADPDFKKSGALFFVYTSPNGANAMMYRVSRIKLDAARTKLDLTSEKILVTFPAQHEAWHSAGAMAFDAYGDLYAAIGDNEKVDEGPGNTADLRGGIMRIHPDDSPAGYSIPKGNFGEVYADYFKTQGKADLAAVYADTNKVKPQIYVKGTRNAYTVTLDPVRRWLSWGDVGPDQQKISEEYNLVRGPQYTGWPYFAGQEDMVGVNPYHYPVPSGSTRLVPVNKMAEAGTVNGAKVLPPIFEPIFARQEACAMTGPIFRYDGRIKSAGNFPPQFNRKWLISGCDGFGFHLMTLDDAGTKVTANVVILGQVHANTLVDLQQGPDGSLYYVSWPAGVFKVDYTGACKDATLLPEATGCADPTASNYDPALPKAFHDQRLCGGISSVRNRALAPEEFRITANSLSIGLAGPHTVEVSDLRGRILLTLHGEGAMSYPLPADLKSGIYQVRIHSSAGIHTRLLNRTVL